MTITLFGSASSSAASRKNIAGPDFLSGLSAGLLGYLSVVSAGGGVAQELISSEIPTSKVVIIGFSDVCIIVESWRGRVWKAG